MSTPAAAALFAKALPRADASTSAMPVEASSSSAGPSTRGSAPARGRGGRGRGRGGRGGPGSRLTDEDVGMSDASEGGVKRRGRQAGKRSSGPMGERPLMKVDGKPYDPRSRGKNAPAVLREGAAPRAQSAPTSTGTSGSPTNSKGAIDTLRLFVSARYSAQDRMLNLENMADDAILKEGGLKAPGEKNAPSNLGPALWKLVSELCPDVISISLANNKLTSILPLSPHHLCSTLPNVQNVSLAANLLRDLRTLDPLSPVINQRKDKQPKGWGNIQELILTGNPLVGEGEAEIKYRSEIARRFPSIRSLDQKAIDATSAFAAAAALPQSDTTPGLSSAAKRDQAKAKAAAQVEFPLSTRAGFFESDQTRDFVAGFLLKFFTAFDNDRASLKAAYAPVCSFSYLIDTMAPFRSRAKKIGAPNDKKFPNQHKLDWKPYYDGSRNLTRVPGPARRVTTLQLDPEDVVAKISKMPNTAHPLDKVENFVFDAWTMPGLLAATAATPEADTVIYATVHGELAEVPSKGLRSFDRTFVLAPALPGSPAQLAGWPCMVLSDMFTLRGYTNPVPWNAPSPPPKASETPAASAPPQAAQKPEGLTDQQHNLILELQQVTRLTYTFAHMALEQNAWDANAALANFQLLQQGGQIPAEAFIPA